MTNPNHDPKHEKEVVILIRSGADRKGRQQFESRCAWYAVDGKTRIVAGHTFTAKVKLHARKWERQGYSVRTIRTRS